MGFPEKKWLWSLVLVGLVVAAPVAMADSPAEAELESDAITVDLLTDEAVADQQDAVSTPMPQVIEWVALHDARLPVELTRSSEPGVSSPADPAGVDRSRQATRGYRIFSGTATPDGEDGVSVTPSTGRSR
jgi:hypothetical protein